MGGAFGRIARLLRRPAPELGDPVSDAELLGRFVLTADQSAFELLVWRHALMVFGVCRRIVRDEHLAEDAFQATFLVLARKAGSVRGSNLAGWLFRVARRVAVRARTQAAARASRELPFTSEPAAATAESGELLAILDEEIGRLPERFRLPVVLCYLGGRSTEEAARVIGCPRGTVLSRLATARSRLVARLTRRGVTVPAALFMVAAVPASLGAVAALVPAAVRLAVGRSAGGASAAVVLAQGVITTMSIAKTITAAGVFVLTVGLVTGFGLIAADGTAPDSAQKAKSKAVQPPEAAKPPALTPTTAEVEEARQERLRNLADQLKSELEVREHEIRRRAEAATGGPAAQARLARLERTIAKLDDEVFASEKEIVELEVQIALLKRKVGTPPLDISPEDLARLVDADTRVTELLKLQKEKQIRLDQELRVSGKEFPSVVALRDEIAALGKAIADTRATVRREVEDRLRGGARKQLESRIADLEERLAVAKEVLTVRKNHRDELEKRLSLQARDSSDLRALTRELAPLQESLRKVESQLLELRIERELRAPPEPKPVGVEGKLDRLIHEVDELRREVRELRKQE
jgi:RNA polymerase sigma factor (sigma-70 family)